CRGRYRVCILLQAEDGILDRNVTGVQTCDLPIWIIHEGRLLEEIAFDKLRVRKRNYLEFQVSDDNKAIMLLESQFGISDYEVHAEGNIRVYSHLGKQGRLNKAFVENGI